MQREILTEGCGRKMRTRVERRPQLGEEEKQRRKYEILQEQKLGDRSGRLEKTCNGKTERKEGLLLGVNRDLAGQGRTELTNLGGKRMNSTTLHSLSLSLSLAGRRQEKRLSEALVCNAGEQGNE